jgi:carbamoyltransferase
LSEKVILGVGGLLNDAAAAILHDGRLAAAVEEKKVAGVHAPGDLPAAAIEACLQIAGLRPEQVTCIAVARPVAAGRESTLHGRLHDWFAQSRLYLVDHHRAHAASAFYLSPFDEATVLTLDRFGDFQTGARWQGQGHELRLQRELYYPDSLGDLYSRTTEFLGFRPNADEHRVQWLSTQGQPELASLFEEIIGADSNGWPKFDRSFFGGAVVGQGGYGEKFLERLPANLGTQGRAHLAASLQKAIERAVIRMAGGASRVCLAGGLSMNVLLVAALEEHFDVFVQPAGGNAGTAIGAALEAWHGLYGEQRRQQLESLFLGPEFHAEEIKRVLENCKLRFRYLLTTDELIDAAVGELSLNRIVAWMQGRMEFGPRALGNRSILASPLDPYSTENLNVFIKHREPYRKFAASVPEEAAEEYFQTGPNARFLATVGRVRPAHRKQFEPALLDDARIRVHVVRQKENPLFHRLLMEAGRKFGLPVLYNTSFNLFGGPLVCSPRDAVRNFYSSGIDSLFAGHFFVQK